jgi:hypothetical protein
LFFIGCIIKEKRSRIFRKYKDHTERESENSIQVAINEEIASYEELDGINIMTDNRFKRTNRGNSLQSQKIIKIA